MSGGGISERAGGAVSILRGWQRGPRDHMERKCELCGLRAALHCVADDANVCWTCDTKVHSANFLVARHVRSILCFNCCQPTDFNACGPHLPPQTRLCVHCSPAAALRPACRVDSDAREHSETLSYPSAATDAEVSGCTCASQESHYSGHKTDLDRRKHLAESIGRMKSSRAFTPSERRPDGVHESVAGMEGRRAKKPNVSLAGGYESQALRCFYPSDERADKSGSGVGSNHVSPTNQLIAPLIFKLLEKEADESSCVSFVDEEGYGQ